MNDKQGIIAVIGGSGFYSLQAEPSQDVLRQQTPYDPTPVSLFRERCHGKDLLFLPRHGREHSIPPHKINYRANIRALKDAGATRILAVNAVGGIRDDMGPGALLIPDQILDYTWGREHSYFDGLGSLHDHCDFTWPYCPRLREALRDAGRRLGQPLVEGGVYGCTQGPRLESAAEVRKLARDGCDMLGMTGMPEAALARELGIDYACVALVVNRAAGLDGDNISMAEIHRILVEGVERVRALLLETIRLLD